MHQQPVFITFFPFYTCTILKGNITFNRLCINTGIISSSCRSKIIYYFYVHTVNVFHVQRVLWGFVVTGWLQTVGQQVLEVLVRHLVVTQADSLMMGET